MCAQSVSRYDDSIMCYGASCATAFHTSCAGVTEESLYQLKTTGDIKKWLCDECKQDHNAVSMQQETLTDVHSEIPPDSMNLDAIIASKVKTAINIISEEVINILKTEVNKMHINNSHLADKIDILQLEIDKMKIENLSLKEEIQKLRLNFKTPPREGGNIIQNADMPISPNFSPKNKNNRKKQTLKKPQINRRKKSLTQK